LGDREQTSDGSGRVLDRADLDVTFRQG
jgi:hypothetical protein